MRKLALLAILLTASATDPLQALVEDLRQEAREEFETMDGIDASELDAYVDAFVADGLARITRRVAMEIDDDGEAQAQFEWVQREPRPPVVAPRPCPATHRCGVCGRASSRHVASPFEVALISHNAEEAAPGLFHQRGKTARALEDVGLPAVVQLSKRALTITEAAFNASLTLAGGLLTRIAAEPDGDLKTPSQKPYWEAHVDQDNQQAYDYSALIYFEDGGVDFEGGALVFDDGETVLPRRGRLVAFSSGPENGHRVARVERGARTALALWFTCAQPE
mmetsp:Transcript_17008/g.44673  ORF Transcript_17008/g.44673 Transcript_17008/m.44673 type:complete len:279 (+) Transcript_17008:80-916(+)